MMDFRSTLKGAVAEVTVRNLLQASGYAVFNTGVEQVVSPIASVSQSRYAQIALPDALRHMADLLVIPPSGCACLLEVKYRFHLDLQSIRFLREKAAKQQAVISDVHTLVIRGLSPAGPKAGVDDIMRIVPPMRLDLLTAGELAIQQPLAGVPKEARAEGFWNALSPISTVFPRVAERVQEVESAVRFFLALARM